MAHRAETIMAAVVTAVTGLTTTGANVFRGRAYDHDGDDGSLPALYVWQGADEVAAEHLSDLLVCTLEVVIEARVAEVSAQVDTKLNLIRSEVTVALAADRQLGLPAMVEGIAEVGTAAPEIGGEGSDRPHASARMVWVVTYRRDRTNPDA